MKSRAKNSRKPAASRKQVAKARQPSSAFAYKPQHDAQYEKMMHNISQATSPKRPTIYLTWFLVITAISALEEARIGLATTQSLTFVAVQAAAMAITVWLLLRKNKFAFGMAAALGFIGIFILPSAIDNFVNARWIEFILDSAAFGLAVATAMFSLQAVAVRKAGYHRIYSK